MAGKLFFSVLLLVVVACPRSTNAQSIENAAIESEEYAVYSAVLSGVYPKPGATRLVIANPAGVKHLSNLKEKSIPFAIAGGPRVSPDVFEDFLQRNRTNRWLSKRMEKIAEYEIIDSREIKKFLNPLVISNNITEFNERFPNAFGFLVLSRVGLNSRMNEALVFSSWTCGHLCGEGELFLLAKQDGAWIIVNRAMLFVS